MVAVYYRYTAEEFSAAIPVGFPLNSNNVNNLLLLAALSAEDLKA